MLRGLRGRLIASYVLVIFVCLVLAGSAVVIVLRDSQQKGRLDEIGYLSVLTSLQVRAFELAGVPTPQIAFMLREQSRALGVRVILADRTGRVLEDTDDELDGQVVRLPGPEPTDRRGTAFRAYFAATDQGMFLVSPPLDMRPTNYAVILAIPQANVAAAWLELAPSLGMAAAVALVVSILVALFLTRSISRPLVRMTRASEEMARGRYDQSIPGGGTDEIGRLATAFNEMARQVSASDRAMRDFLANVSHELKTPLTSIRGFSQAMLDGTIRDADGYQRAATIIDDETNRMRGLVDDLLTLSKIESGQIAMDDARVDIDGLLRETVRRSDWQLEGRETRLTLDSRPGAIVRGDARWLAQVFSNLLDNAMRHAPRAGRITIRAVARADSNDVTISVHNTGSFIPPEDLPRVFERFFQVDRSRAGRGHGSGLGLAIVREVVQAHSGTVIATSDERDGTTFVVHLPLHELTASPPIPFAPRRVA
ncbi:MAG: sensor histidine kinase [Chloroflexota bacterium]|nr:MAG: sensor histidine kinase [Chloroflexota bacterium]